MRRSPSVTVRRSAGESLSDSTWRSDPLTPILGLRRVAKDYIDLMRGMVYSDDAVIDHVEVHRPRTARDRTLAVIRCFPLAVFNADFDRAFRVWDELGFQAPDRGWGRHFDDGDREVLAHDSPSSASSSTSTRSRRSSSLGIQMPRSTSTSPAQ
ncbi:MAG TPA: hypothetical protein VME22_32865 [Solirubrobacteraceae bacterium]|nr:hypothetical protein [Solirubrobacteraceae bacterium]